MGTMSVDFMVMGRLCRRSCRKSPNHAFHAGSNWMIRQSPTLRRLGNINIAAAHCRRALRRSQSTTMRRVLKSDDMLLIEQVDRLSRLTAADWQKLRADLDAKQIRVVALDLPTSWMLAGPADDFTGRMFRALNSMMLDMLAAIARKHYDDRRRRQAQGVAKAKAEGKYRGRPEDTGPTPGLLRCCATVRHGRRFRTPSDAAGRRSPRSPSEPRRHRTAR